MRLENASRAQHTHAAAPTEKAVFRSQIYLLFFSICPWADSVISLSLTFLPIWKMGIVVPTLEQIVNCTSSDHGDGRCT